MAGDLHHTAQPPTLAAFRPWGSLAGAGRVRPAGANIRNLVIYLGLLTREFALANPSN